MKRKISILLSLFLFLLMLFTLCSCTFKTNTYKITLVLNENVEILETNNCDELIKYIEEKYADFDIIGWYLDDTLYDFNNELSSDLTLIAKLNENFNKFNPTNYNGNERTVKIKVVYADGYDPFNEFYLYNDKLSRQNHQKAIEEAYNIKIEYVENNYYNDELSIWVIQDVIGKPTDFDLNKDYYKLDERFINENPILNAQMGSYGYTNSIYDQQLLLYYSQNLIDELGLEDPLTLWNEGKWTTSYFNEYISKLIISDEYKNLHYPVFSKKINELIIGFSAANGDMLIPSLDNVNIASENNQKIIYQLNTYRELGYIGDSFYGIFNAFYTYDICAKYVTYYENDVIKAVPFPINDEEVQLLIDGNLSEANYKVATIPGLGIYCIPMVEDEEDLSKEVLENIMYDLVVQYETSKPYFISDQGNLYAEFNYDELNSTLEQIKNNLHSEYYFDIDSNSLYSFFTITSYQELDEKNINDTLINLSDYIKYLISSQFNVK